MARVKVSHAELLRRLDYNSESGVFVWKAYGSARRGGSGCMGCIAGKIHPLTKYRQISIDRVGYYAHRLAWFYIYGVWPEHDIDHINGERDDNRIKNLRTCTRAENKQNNKVHVNNTSGLTGAVWNKRKKCWMAYITVNYKQIYLGCFATKERAHAAYLTAKAKYHTFQPVPRKLATG